MADAHARRHPGKVIVRPFINAPVDERSGSRLFRLEWSGGQPVVHAFSCSGSVVKSSVAGIDLQPRCRYSYLSSWNVGNRQHHHHFDVSSSCRLRQLTTNGHGVLFT